jgi:predicted ArsR family transcriptional regulator
MARRTFDVVDVTEILAHWYAGRSKNQIAESLGLDRKTVRKYLAPAEAAGLVRAGGRSARRSGGSGQRGRSRSWLMPGCGR